MYFHFLTGRKKNQRGAAHGEAEDFGGGGEVVLHLALVVGEAGLVEEGGVGFVVEDFGGAGLGVDEEDVDDAAERWGIGGVERSEF